MAKKQSLEKKKMMREQSAHRKAERAREENRLLGYCMGLMGVLAVAEIYFLMCYRFFVQGSVQNVVTMSSLIGGVSYAGLALLIVGLVLAFMRRGKKYGHAAAWAALLGGLLFAGGRLMLAIYPAGTQLMCVAVPLLALAGFVYYLYQKEFFVSGLGLGFGAFAMWLAHRAVGTGWSSRYVLVDAAVLAVIVALLVFCIVVGKNGGKWGKEEKERVIFSESTDYRVAYGALILTAIGVLLAIFLPAVGLYMMWASLALLFVIAVYYTVHLM